MSVDVRNEATRHPGADGDVLVRLTGLKKYFPITRGIIFQKRVEIGRAHV